MSNKWDEMKHAREEEYFHREELAKIEAFKKTILEQQQKSIAANEQLSALRKAESPVSGSLMYKIVVDSHHVLDCPEEQTILLSYAALQDMLHAAQQNNTHKLNVWQALVETPNLEEK